MGLTSSSVGLSSIDRELKVKKTKSDEIIVALAGNPNVGKSTVFNALTGLKQHTGNWSGKTVANAQGSFSCNGKDILLVDIPGCYSLLAHSAEEEIARDFICFGDADKTVVVCDATCLERNLALVLQTLEINGSCIVCVNLMDEAKKKGFHIDINLLSTLLSVPVVATEARKGKGLTRLCRLVTEEANKNEFRINYPEYVEEIIRIMTPAVENICKEHSINPRWLSLRLFENDKSMISSLRSNIGNEFFNSYELKEALNAVDTYLSVNMLSRRTVTDAIAASYITESERICKAVLKASESGRSNRDRCIDKILTSRTLGFPIMLLLFAGIFWLTITGANYPSALLNKILLQLEDFLYNGAVSLGLPTVFCEVLFRGVYHITAWVVSVMLPPMAIFFPLFTILEDIGFLPRIAFNLDRAFSACKACGKQSLTMCMGFGCNAAGIVGCRIIDSPRERLIAILTNVFVPCNGRFPTLISIITMFFLAGASGFFTNLLSALMLTAVILLGIGVTLLSSKLLSATLLRGIPSSFTLELPPYRKPQFLKIIVRSIFDRTLFVLGRAAAVAAPAGLIIWLLANITVDGLTLLNHLTGFLDPFARIFGLDGVILAAFVLGFPANEIVIPIIIMTYMANGTLIDIGNLSFIKTLFIDNNWTQLTALNVMLFTLIHFPCSTTLITIYRETKSLKWSALAFLLPTALGLLLCFITTIITNILF